MFLFKQILFVYLLFGLSFQYCNAEGDTVGLSYLSWSEFIELDNGNTTDKAFANFYGNAFSYEIESYQSNSLGYSVEAAALVGQANAGGTQQNLTYQTSYKNWWGAQLTARLAYRSTPEITFAIGPTLLNRQITWPSEGSNISVKSGANFNFGVLTDLRLRLNQKWELRQTIGALTNKTSTIWSLGVGYKF